MSSLNIAVSRAVSHFRSKGGSSCWELFKQEIVYADSESDQTIMNRGKDASLICVVTQFGFTNTCQLENMDVILCNSRKSHNRESYPLHTDASSKADLTIDTMFDCGVHLSVQQAFATVSFEGGIIKLLIVFTGVKSDVIKYSLETVERPDQFDPQNLLSSLNCLCEASFSDCKLNLRLNTSGESVGLECSGNDSHASASEINSGMSEDSLRVMNSERSLDHSCHWLCAEVSMSEVYLAECSVKNILVDKYRSNKLEASLSVGGQFQDICWQSEVLLLIEH